MASVTKLLIANRGEIACRVARTARAMGIATVAVYSEPDTDALHVHAADEAVALGGSTPAGSYLRIDALVEAAGRTGADAVHPGYGFLAENAAFARACADAGLTFVGPSAEVIARMGDKLVAKDLIREAGVPVLDSFALDAGGVDDDARSSAARLGFPVLVKAAAGGGGTGMRIVRDPDDLSDAVEAARRESQAAFGDPRLFIEPYVARTRHVEIQIIGDHAGAVLHLGERECSIQRRFGKIIEESPSPAVDAALRRRMGEAAVRAATALGYTNAGTVEFLLAPDGRFYFLEVNTRLQVEHPVTEMAWTVDGEPLDLVRLQLLVARGRPLGFGQDDVALGAHAIEARVYAEDPAAGFLPATGVLEVWEPASLAGVRIDDGVRSGSDVSIHYDPMLAKAIAAAPTRTEAALLLARALDTSRIHGVTTNRDFLVAVLRHDAFLAGDLHTGFIDEHLPDGGGRVDGAVHRWHAAVAALAAAHARARSRPVLTTIPAGWRNNRSQPQRVSYETAAGERIEVGYHLRRDGGWQLDVDGVTAEATVHAWAHERADGRTDGEGDVDGDVEGDVDGDVEGDVDGDGEGDVDGDVEGDVDGDVELGGVRRRVHVSFHGDRVYVDSAAGHSSLRRQPRFPRADAAPAPGGLTAPMPGTVVTVAVEAGSSVAAGDLLMVLEAMKMEHRIPAPRDGTVTEVRVAAGDGVAAGDVLAVVDPS